MNFCPVLGGIGPVRTKVVNDATEKNQNAAKPDISKRVKILQLRTVFRRDNSLGAALSISEMRGGNCWRHQSPIPVPAPEG